MPSTISTSVSSALASSTVITPSLPTFCIASAIILPIVSSPLAEMVPTCATSAEEPTFLARFLISATTAVTARSIPRLRSIGFMPAATALAPSLTIAAARTVAVVVPSPASSFVFEATSRTIWAPIFSNLSSSSISLATVTPSLVMRGAPKLLSITTLRPFGPSVTFTALASVSTPRSKRSRASLEKRTSFEAIIKLLLRVPVLRGGSGDDAHNVGLLHDQEILALELDFGSGPLAEQHAVAGLEVDGDQLAALVAATRPHGDDFALLRLLLGAVRNDDAALRLFLCLDALDDHTIVQGTEFEFRHDDPRCRCCAACVFGKVSDYRGLALSTSECHEAAAEIRCGPEAVKRTLGIEVTGAGQDFSLMALAGKAKTRHHAGQ